MTSNDVWYVSIWRLKLMPMPALAVIAAPIAKNARWKAFSIVVAPLFASPVIFFMPSSTFFVFNVASNSTLPTFAISVSFLRKRQKALRDFSQAALQAALSFILAHAHRIFLFQPHQLRAFLRVRFRRVG